MVNDQLAAAGEEIGKRLGAIPALEDII